jgi:TPR repeat protein
MLHADSADPDVLTCTARTFGRACDLDDIWGCSMLGLAYSRGLGVPADPVRAATALLKACARPSDATHEACTSAMQELQQLDAARTKAPSK